MVSSLNARDQRLASTGSRARIGPNDPVTNDPDILRRMLAVRSLYTRGLWYDAIRFDPARDNLLSMRDEDAYTSLRSKMAAGVKPLDYCNSEQD
jgi:hypothetical protein